MLTSIFQQKDFSGFTLQARLQETDGSEVSIFPKIYNFGKKDYTTKLFLVQNWFNYIKFCSIVSSCTAVM